jgi:hypothetical protein
VGQHFIPKERLFELVQRKLEGLGIHSHVDDDGTGLRGAIEDAAGVLRHPRTGEALGRLGFEVVGSNALQLTAPPILQALPPVQFYEFDQVPLLLERIAEQLKRRYAGLVLQRDRLAGFGLAATIDDERGLVLVRVALPDGTRVELEAGVRNLVARTLLLPDGGGVPMGDVPVLLEEYPSAAALVAGLIPYAEHALQAQAEGAPLGEELLSEVVAEAPLLDVAPAPGVLHLGALTSALGPRFLVAPGVVLRGEWNQATDRVRLDLRHLGGVEFEASITRNGQELWRGRTTLGELQRPAALVERALAAASARASS